MSHSAENDALDDLTGADFHRAADETNDAADHDELHAAGVILESDPIWALTTPYVLRWLQGLVKRHGLRVIPPA